MKKLLLLLLAFPLFAWIVVAQVPEREVFPRSNAIWNIKLPNSLTTSSWYGLVGDTTINDIIYQKLYQLRDSTLSNTSLEHYIAGIRQENKKVWMRIGFHCFPEIRIEKEVLLYDFTLEVGDTIPIYYNIDLINGFSNYGSYYFNLIEPSRYDFSQVTNIFIDNQGRKHLQIKLQEGRSDEWIEGIGGTRGLFWAHCTPAITTGSSELNIRYSNLNCFKHNEKIKYQSNKTTDCQTCFCLNQLDETPYNNIEIETISLKSIASIGYISGQNIRIELSEKLLDSFFELYDLSGVLLLSQSLTDQMTEFSLGKLPQGVYLYRISDSGKNSQAGKIILQ